MNNQINFELYKVFYYVAQTLSFSKAAAKLFISQSAVSQSIKSLESLLDSKLFLRNSKNVILTEEGRVLFEHIQPAFHLIKSAETNIKEINTLQKGKIRIGASDTICKYYLLPYFQKYHSLYPDIQIHITNRTSTKCVNLLKQGKLDFIVTNLPNDNITESMECRTICEFSDVFIAKKDMFPNPITIATLNKHVMIMLEKNTTTRKFSDKVFKDMGIDIVPDIELTSVDLMIELARIGLGISFVPDYCIELKNKDTDLVKIELDKTIPKRSLGIVSDKNIPCSLAAEKFMDML